MTDYFSSFPTITYQKKEMKNITIRLDFLDRIKNNIALFERHQLRDDERPEDVALNYYGDSALYWIVLYMNDIVDPFYDWLLNEQRLIEYVSNKYGAENVYATHHYETTAQSELGEGVFVDFGTPFSTAVSNYEHEDRENEKKREIKILKRRYVAQVISEYNKELRDL